VNSGPELLCSEVQDRIAGWLDGELGPSEAELFARHLDACAACATEVARVERQTFGLGATPDTSAPGFWDGLDAAVMRELDEVEGASVGEATTAPAQWSLRLTRTQLVALAALLVLAIGLAGVQTARIAASQAEVAALQQALRHEQRADAMQTTLPVEPVTVAVHSPYRGSL